MRNTEQSDRDGIHHSCIERYAWHVQTRTFAVAGFAAVVLAIGVSGSIARMWHRRRLFAAFMLGAGGIARPLSRRVLKGQRHRADRHGVTQLADDQTGHQQENQGPALPAKLTHGARVQASAATRNDVDIKSQSFTEASSYTAWAAP